MMNLRASRRALRGIEQYLAHSDPHLNVLFESFTAQARNAKMPSVEMTETRSPRLFGWLGRRADYQREGTDGRARPRTFP
jgi:hypothetical protein